MLDLLARRLRCRPSARSGGDGCCLGRGEHVTPSTFTSRRSTGGRFDGPRCPRRSRRARRGAASSIDELELNAGVRSPRRSSGPIWKRQGIFHWLYSGLVSGSSPGTSNASRWGGRRARRSPLRRSTSALLPRTIVITSARRQACASSPADLGLVTRGERVDLGPVRRALQRRETDDVVAPSARRADDVGEEWRCRARAPGSIATTRPPAWRAAYEMARAWTPTEQACRCASAQ